MAFLICQMIFIICQITFKLLWTILCKITLISEPATYMQDTYGDLVCKAPEGPVAESCEWHTNQMHKNEQNSYILANF